MARKELSKSLDSVELGSVIESLPSLDLSASPVEVVAAPVITDTKAQNYEKLRLRDRRMVKGLFKFHEVQNGRLEFSFRKWKGDPVETFKMDDNTIHEIPFGVATHLANNCTYPVHSFQMDEKNVPIMKVQQNVHRTSFQSLEFLDAGTLGAH